MASPADEERRNWAELPREVTASIFSRLTVFDILTRAQFVCKAWLEVSKNPFLWKRIVIRSVRNRDRHDLLQMYRNAVDRSCGQIVDIDIEFIGDDDLLNYISLRSSQIERLQIIFCYKVSKKMLIETVKKLPCLEDLELTMIRRLKAETIEALGRKCPPLRSFKLNSMGFDSDAEDCDGQAFAIAKSMACLRSLELRGNSLTNNGLGAILDGCPGLDSLDLRKCQNVHLEGQVWERCVDLLERLCLPEDSTEDCQLSRALNAYFFDDDDDDHCV